MLDRSQFGATVVRMDKLNRPRLEPKVLALVKKYAKHTRRSITAEVNSIISEFFTPPFAMNRIARESDGYMVDTPSGPVDPNDMTFIWDVRTQTHRLATKKELSEIAKLPRAKK
jgi:hypothetical protein